MLRQTHIRIILLLLLLVPGLSGCMSYYARGKKFNDQFRQGNMQAADQTLASDKKGPSRKDRVLYYMNRGSVNAMMGNYAASNEYFENALTASEGIQNNYLITAGSLLTNPILLPYRGEDHELLMVHYFKALNYLNLRDYDAALVECRRMNEKLNALADKYKTNNRYRRDAFIHTLMGIIYDADHDFNNAFIAYRNAYNIYEEDYSTLYGMQAPEQLKSDLLRAAARTGLSQEVKYYEKKFGMKYESVKDTSGEMVFFWMNGLGPVKDQTSLNFTVVAGQGNMVHFTNEQMGVNFPFYYSPDKNRGESGLSSLHLIRLALPKYVERKPVYSSARLNVNNQSVNLEKAEDINQIAFQSLNDRMLRELGTGLLRLAIKKSEELAIREKNQDLGAAMGVVNFLTEQADTRNWQTLPYSISYARVKLPAGEQKVTLEQYGRSNQRQSQTFTVQVRPGQTLFEQFHTTDAQPAGYYR